MFLISIILILVIFYFQPLFTSPTYAIFNKTNNENKSNSVPIIFVFAVSNVSCKWGFPDYIKISLGIYNYILMIQYLSYQIIIIFIYLLLSNIRTSYINSTKFTCNISVKF